MAEKFSFIDEVFVDRRSSNNERINKKITNVKLSQIKLLKSRNHAQFRTEKSTNVGPDIQQKEAFNSNTININ